MHITFIQDIIDLIRGKSLKKYRKYKDILVNNKINIPRNIKNNVILNIVGKNNTVIISENHKISGNINIDIYGDNNKVILGDDFHVSGLLSILIGQHHPNFGKVRNSHFIVGKNVSVSSVNYVTFNSNTFCNIEDECMFSYGITIYNTDAHPIFKKGTTEVINKVKGITIGRHSWVGMNVTILKNSKIPSNSIVGCNAVFSGGGRSVPYCAFAGNPAKVVKENVDWSSNGSKYGYIDNENLV